MKYRVKRFKSPQMCLTELKPFVLNGQHLLTGKPFNNLNGMRSREALANWLICVTLNFSWQEERFTFSSDPAGGDGVIFDSTTKDTYPTEHVIALRRPDDVGMSAEDLIHRAVLQKQEKGGKAYSSGKYLAIFLECDGSEWFPNRAARGLPQELGFGAVWVVGLYHAKGSKYIYSVTSLDLNGGDAPTCLVHIDWDSDSWRVVPVQGFLISSLKISISARFLPCIRVLSKDIKNGSLD